MTMPTPPLKLAIIGCGAITEHVHLPAAVGLEEIEVAILVDRNRARAEELAKRHGIPRVAEDATRLPVRPDAALIALPNHLHAPMSLEFLRQGIHVLVEKPMALTVADCDEMIRVAAGSGAKLAVGLVRRFLPEVRRVKAVLESGALGKVESFEVREGRVYAWPTTTDAAFRSATAGGGVLMDVGVHTLDTLIFWLGEIESYDYRDDSHGGVEAECEIDLLLANGVRGHVELSRTRDLGESVRIRGTEGVLEVDLATGMVNLLAGGAEIAVGDAEAAVDEDIFRVQLRDWVAAIRGVGDLAVPGTEGRRSVAGVEACYAGKKPLILAWGAADLAAGTP